MRGVVGFGVNQHLRIDRLLSAGAEVSARRLRKILMTVGHIHMASRCCARTLDVMASIVAGSSI